MEYTDIFSHSPTDVGTANCEDITIHLTQQVPIHAPNYHTPLKYREWMEQELNNLMAAGIIERSTSAYNSPAMAVPKKLDTQDLGEAHQSKGMCLVVDFRRLNSFMEDVTFPMPRISDIMGAYIGCDVFSATDVYHTFYTVRIDKASRHITTFSCKFGKFQFCFLPQGLKISPAVFQCIISTHLAAVPASNPYIDDILTAFKGNDAHLRDLQQLFQAIRTSCLKFRLNKCSFFKQTIEFAGYMLSKTGVSVTPSKIQDVTKLAPPTTVAEVRSLLRFTNFLRDHIPHYAAIAQPIQDLIPKVQGKKKASILEFWTPLCQQAFDSLKESLLQNTVLRFPDPNQPFILYTDASKHHMAAVLLQDNAPISYFSKAFTKTQCKWAAFTKEAYVVYAAVLFYKVFITGCKVKLMCNHKPLKGFLQATTKNDMVNCWSINIQEYDISFQWVETSKNLSDCLTQLVDPQLFTPLPIEQVDDPDAITVTAIQTTEPALIQLSTDDIRHLQRSNAYCKHIFASFDTDPCTRRQFSTKDGILYRLMQVSGVTHLALVIPQSLALTLVRSVHLEFQHPGAARTYDALAT